MAEIDHHIGGDLGDIGHRLQRRHWLPRRNTREIHWWNNPIIACLNCARAVAVATILSPTQRTTRRLKRPRSATITRSSTWSTSPLRQFRHGAAIIGRSSAA